MNFIGNQGHLIKTDHRGSIDYTEGILTDLQNKICVIATDMIIKLFYWRLTFA